MSQAEGTQPAALKRRRSEIRAGAVSAAHARLFGDGDRQIAALKRAPVTTTRSPWWTAAQGFEKYVKKSRNPPREEKEKMQKSQGKKKDDVPNFDLVAQID